MDILGGPASVDCAVLMPGRVNKVGPIARATLVAEILLRNVRRVSPSGICVAANSLPLKGVPSFVGIDNQSRSLTKTVAEF